MQYNYLSLKSIVMEKMSSARNKLQPKIEDEQIETKENDDKEKVKNAYGIYMVGADSSLASDVLTTIQAVSNASSSFNNEDEKLLDKRQRDVWLIWGYIGQNYEYIHCYVPVELKTIILKYFINELSKISVEINLTESQKNINYKFNMFYHLWSDTNFMNHIEHKYAKHNDPLSIREKQHNLSAIIWVANVSIFDQTKSGSKYGTSELSKDFERFKLFINNAKLKSFDKYDKLKIFILFTQTEDLKNKSMIDSFEAYIPDFRFDYISYDRYDEQVLKFVREKYIEQKSRYNKKKIAHHDIPNVFDMNNISKVWRNIYTKIIKTQR